MSSKDLLSLEIIDEIIYEPKGGAHRDRDTIINEVKKSIRNNLNEHVKQSKRLAYKHNIVADGITEQLYVNDSLNVYGVLYDYEGMTATATQFFLTDSINHFFRGALYFNTEVCDSILPINNFLKQDIKHLIETFRWKDK